MWWERMSECESGRGESDCGRVRVCVDVWECVRKFVGESNRLERATLPPIRDEEVMGVCGGWEELDVCVYVCVSCLCSAGETDLTNRNKNGHVHDRCVCVCMWCTAR